jgi:hypothetical protein
LKSGILGEDRVLRETTAGTPQQCRLFKKQPGF